MATIYILLHHITVYGRINSFRPNDACTALYTSDLSYTRTHKTYPHRVIKECPSFAVLHFMAPVLANPYLLKE